MIHGASFAAAGLRPTPLGRTHPAAALGYLGLGLVGAYAVAPPFLLIQLLILATGLAWSGLDFRRQIAALRPWWLVATLVLGVHTFTTVEAAPLGVPSVAGLMAGVLALGRVACAVAWLGLFLRVMDLDDLVAGLRWWLTPLERLGVPVADFGLVLAVALGTAPVVLGEGRRIRAVVRMRRAGARPSASRWRTVVTRLMDNARIVVPLLEALTRRGEALSLTLRRRRASEPPAGSWPVLQIAVFLLWAGLLIYESVRRSEGAWW